MIHSFLILLILCWSTIIKGESIEKFIKMDGIVSEVEKNVPYTETFKMKNNKLYYKGSLFTGDSIEENNTIFHLPKGNGDSPKEIKTIYKNGIIIKKYEKSYEVESIASSLDIINKDKFESYMLQLDDKGQWVNTNEIETQYYSEKLNFSRSHSYFDEDNNEINFKNFKLQTFNGTFVTKINDTLIYKAFYKKGFLYKELQYSLEGILEYELNLKKSFLKNYSGFKKWYYSNGNVRKESKIKYVLEFIGPIDRFNDGITGIFALNGNQSSPPRKLIENNSMFVFTKYYDLDGNLIMKRENNISSFFSQGEEVSYKTIIKKEYPYVEKYYEKNSKGDLKLIESYNFYITKNGKQYLLK